MGAIAEYLNPALWRDWLHAGVDQFGYTAFWFAVVRIMLINVLLSGDNAVVIAMACRGLPPHQRRWGLGIGVGVAALLLIIFTGIVTRLMLLAYLKLIGGVALLVIAAKLIVPEAADRNEIEAVAHLWRAIRIVVVADLIMSLDNIIAVAAAAKGDFLLLGDRSCGLHSAARGGRGFDRGVVCSLPAPGLGRRGTSRLGRRRDHCDRSGAIGTSGGEHRRDAHAAHRIRGARHRRGAGYRRGRAVAALGHEGQGSRGRIGRASGGGA